MESKSLVNFIEKVRYGRNISQEKMLDGVISIRQYRRYLYGEVEIPFGVVAQVAQKLGISANKLLLDFEDEKNKERRLVTSYYNAVVTRNLNLANKYINNIDIRNIMERENKLIFLSGNAIHDFFSDKITNDELIKRHKKIVNYPEILKNEILTDSEMIILASILEEDSLDKEDIVDRFEKVFINNEFYITGDNAATMLQIVFWLAKYYGKMKKYKKTIEYCDFGIEKNKELRTTYVMEFFSYYKALSYKRLGEISKFKKSLYEAILYVEIIPSQTRKDRFKDIIRKDLGIEPLEFVRDYIDLVKLK